MAALACLLLVSALAAPARAQAAPAKTQRSGLPSLECLRLLRSARIAGMEGDIEREREILRSAVGSFPREVAPVYALLMHHRLHPLAEEEHAQFRRALEARLEDPEQDLPIAALHGVISDPAADEDMMRLLARHFERRLETLSPDRSEVLHSLAILQDRLQAREAAVETLAEIRQLAPSSPMTWALYRSLVDLERWDEALAVFQDLLAEDEAGNLRHTHVQLLGRTGRTEEQARTIERYIKDTPEGETGGAPWLGTLKASAWDLRDAGRDEEAEELFETVRRLNPEDTDVIAILTHLYGSDEMRAGLRDLEEARWQAEEDPRVLFDNGTEKLASGDAQGALELLRRAAPQLETLEAAWYNLGMAAYRVAEWRTADTAFERASKLNPTRAESFFFRGMALNQLEDCRGTVTALERALQLDAERKTAHYYLAACYRNLGDDAAAARHKRLDAESREQ